VKRLLLIAAAALVVSLGQASAGHAQTLTGSVTSAEEGAMEGVLVSAQAAGSPLKEWDVPPPYAHPLSVRCLYGQER